MSYVIPLGPFHQAWPGPFRLALRVEDEQIIDLEYRGGYSERNLAERLRRTSLSQALESVRRLCGVDSYAHTLGFCLAVEQLMKAEPPRRATLLRMTAAELERALAHTQAVAESIGLLGLERAAEQLQLLRRDLAECQRGLCGPSLSGAHCVLLGVAHDLTSAVREQLLLGLKRAERNLYRFIDQLIDTRGLLRRTVGVGAVGAEPARLFGVRGPFARAAGIANDIRLDLTYAAYEQFPPRLVIQERGDVYSRLVVLLLEGLESIKLALQLQSDLPEGPWVEKLAEKIPSGIGTAVVESSRGQLRYSVETDGVRVRSLLIDPPRQLDRLLIRTLLQGALLDDAVMIVASTAPCVACAEV